MKRREKEGKRKGIYEKEGVKGEEEDKREKKRKIARRKQDEH